MRLVQITDLHLWTHPNDPRTLRYLEDADLHPNATDNLGSLRAVLDAISAHHCGGRSFDALVVTGDIAQDEQRSTYQLLRDELQARGWLGRALLLPGNHEQAGFFRDVFPESSGSERPEGVPQGGFSAECNGWRLVGVDTHDTDDAKVGWGGEMDDLLARGWDGGSDRIGEPQLQWLQRELAEHAAQPTVVFIHHPIMPVGFPWVDSILIEQPGLKGLHRILARSPQVRAVHCGHIHQSLSEQGGLLQLEDHDDGNDIHRAVRVFSAPSTAYQQLPRTEEATVAVRGPEAMPGWRLLEGENGDGDAWHATLSTAVHRVAWPPSYDYATGARL